MKPVQLNLEMYSDSAYDETVEVYVNGIPQDFDGWEFAALAATGVTATEPLFELAVTVKAKGVLALHVDPEALQPLFAGNRDTKATVQWVLKARPAADYYVRLCYGTITVKRGLM